MIKSLKSFIKSRDKKEILIPLLQDFLNKEEADMLSGKVSKKASVIYDAKLTIKCFKNRLEEFNHGEDPVGEYFHPSRLGTCQRQIFFDMFGATRDAAKSGAGNGEDLLRRYLIFETGTYIHVMIQNLCSRAGLLLKREVAIIDKTEKVIGHADAKLRIGEHKYVLEIKTINAAGFFKLDGPKHEHKAQAHAYMKCIGCSRAIFLYYNKDQNSLKEFTIEFDPVFYREFVRERIDKFFVQVRKRQLPEPEGTNPRAFPCMFCPFTKVCWETGRADAFLAKIKNEKTKPRHEN